MSGDVVPKLPTRRSPNVWVGIAEFTRTMHEAVVADPTAVWARITGAAVALLPKVRHASITVVDNRSVVQSRACTDRHAAAVDEVQQCYLQGPSIDAARNHEAVHVGDLGAESRWPTFVANGGSTPIRSLLAFPLFQYEGSWGALTLYADESQCFADEPGQIAEAFSHNAAVIVEASHRERQLHHLLTNRDIIGQAKGVLMERFGIDAVTAFAMLAELSDRQHQSVPTVARKLLRAKPGQPAARRASR
jgi:transcriptional regulator with GAF, ATPase, and Fis domain